MDAGKVKKVVRISETTYYEDDQDTMNEERSFVDARGKKRKLRSMKRPDYRVRLSLAPVEDSSSSPPARKRRRNDSSSPPKAGVRKNTYGTKTLPTVPIRPQVTSTVELSDSSSESEDDYDDEEEEVEEQEPRYPVIAPPLPRYSNYGSSSSSSSSSSSQHSSSSFSSARRLEPAADSPRTTASSSSSSSRPSLAGNIRGPSIPVWRPASDRMSPLQGRSIAPPPPLPAPTPAVAPTPTAAPDRFPGYNITHPDPYDYPDSGSESEDDPRGTSPSYEPYQVHADEFDIDTAENTQGAIDQPQAQGQQSKKFTASDLPRPKYCSEAARCVHFGLCGDCASKHAAGFTGDAVVCPMCGGKTVALFIQLTDACVYDDDN
jgi:hypothetical protein